MMETRTLIQRRIENYVTNGTGYKLIKISPTLKTLQAGLSLALGTMDIKTDFNESLMGLEEELNASLEDLEIRYSAARRAGLLK